jgi:DNA polymerase-3 subunit delta'
MGFTDIVGHRKQLEILRAALAGSRLHHAYVFVGPDGIGKKTMALALAKAIHCAERDYDFCGRCVNCARIADGNHPDVRLVELVPGKKEISIEQIRSIERELSYRSFTGKRKVLIIDPATLMNLSAQNALLKTLEEPPPDSLIILIAANAGGLLPTIRSRCLPLSFVPLQRQEVAAFLEAKYAMKPADAKVFAAMSMGSIGAAANLDKEELYEKRRIWSGMLGSLKVGDYRAAMIAAEALAANRDEASKFLKWAQSWYRDLLIYGVTGKRDELVNLDMQEQIEQQSVTAGGARALAASVRITDAAAGIQRNLNRRMVLERFLFGVVGGR